MNDLVNDLGKYNRNGAVDSAGENSRRESEPGKPPKGANRPRRRRGGRLFGLGGLLLLAAGLTLGGWGDYSLKREVATTATRERDFVPSLHVATVEANAKTVTVSLPGTTAAFAAANIYARATGYIAKRNVDIGDRVKAGDLLAALAVPELDHQISQNEATLDQLKSALLQARANRDLAQVTWNRDAPLVQKGWFTPQQGDTDRLNLQARTAAVAVAKVAQGILRRCGKHSRIDRADGPCRITEVRHNEFKLTRARCDVTSTLVIRFCGKRVLLVKWTEDAVVRTSFKAGDWEALLRRYDSIPALAGRSDELIGA
jgi:multidrug resistance efflux pump